MAVIPFGVTGTNLAFPDIEADPQSFGVVSWDMQPGDCVVFNSRIMHGGSGRLAEDRDLRVFTSKWLGDDVRIKFRQGGMDPDHSAVMTERGLDPALDLAQARFLVTELWQAARGSFWRDGTKAAEIQSLYDQALRLLQ